MSGLHADIDAFVESLRAAKMPDASLVNIYSDEHDPFGWRRARLTRWLELPRDDGPVVLMVGEAPGVHGAAVTGVPFTSVETLTANEFERLHVLKSDEGFVAVEGTQPNYKEATARAFWRAVLPEFEDLPLPMVWNAIPFWPRGNATPSRYHQWYGLCWLATVLNWHTYAEVVAVGRAAEHALKQLPSEFRYVRHPSRGGATKFAAGLKAIVDSLRS